MHWGKLESKAPARPMTSLARQAAAFRQRHGLPDTSGRQKSLPPSLLFTPVEAARHDQGSFAALALRGLAGVAALEPEAAAFAPLFQGQAKDRETLSRDEADRLDNEIHKLLRLLSPHLLVRAAQEVVEGLIQRYSVHQWNVDAVLECALPYHDSLMFTRLLEGLHVKGKPRWSWLQTLKEKPATLVRAAFAKYCSKDISVLAFVGEAVMDAARLHRSNRPLATFFAAIWLDTLAATKSVSPDQAAAALPALLLLLRRPQLRDLFHAALLVTAGLCAKAHLHSSTWSQLFERIARQAAGEHSRAATSAMALLLQLQGGALPEKALRSLAQAGATAGLSASRAHQALDCRNLWASALEASLCKEAKAPCGEELQVFVRSLLSDTSVVDEYAEALALAALQAFSKSAGSAECSEGERQRAAEAVRPALEAVGAQQPAALGTALRRATAAITKGGGSAGPLLSLVAPACSVVSASDDVAGSLVPMVQAFADASAKVRAKAVHETLQHLLGSNGKDEESASQRLWVGLVLQATGDASPQVIQNALQSKEFWTTMPDVDASIRALEAVMERLLAKPTPQGNHFNDIFRSILGESSRAVLVPPSLRCFSWVYTRADCDTAARQRMDTFLLPCLVLCAIGLEALEPLATAGGASRGAAQAELKAALHSFCSASEHRLFQGVEAAGCSSLSQAMVQSTDATVALGLCGIIQGRFRPAPPSPPVALGGVAAQLAAATLLAGALPRLLPEVASSPERGEELLLHAAQGCQWLFWQQSLLRSASSGALADSGRALLRAVVSGVATWGKQQGAGIAGGGDGEKKRRRRSRGDGNPRTIAPDVMRTLLRVLLDRPRSLASELRQALALAPATLRPALLQLALEPHSSELRKVQDHSMPQTAGISNALRLVRSLVVAGSQDWAPDQSLLVPLMSQLVSSEAQEVRAATLEVLEAFSRKLEWEKVEFDPAWASAGARYLREAGLLRAASDALPPQAWTATKEQALQEAGTSATVIRAFLEHVLAHRGEILKDRLATVLVLSKFLSGKGGAARGAAESAACFWALGLAMLPGLLPGRAAALLAALPGAPLLQALAPRVLRTAVEELLAELRRGEPRAPEVLRTAALVASGLAEAGLASKGMREKARSASKEALETFAQQVAQPLCLGIAEVYEQGVAVPQCVVDILQEVCRSTSGAAKWALDPEVLRSAVAGLFRLSVAAACFPGPNSGDLEEAGRAPAAAQSAAAASSALSEANLGPELLQHLLGESTSLTGRSLVEPRGRAAAELLCRGVVGCVAAAEGRSSSSSRAGLLVALARTAQEAAAQHIQGQAAGKEVLNPPALLHLLAAMAALAESFVGEQSDEAQLAPACVQQVSGCIAAVCKAMGRHLTSGMLSTIIQTCGALSVVSPLQEAGASVGAFDAMPAPLQACLTALQCSASPLAPEAAALLRQNLRRLWSYPGPVSPGALTWDAVAQGRIRLLLHAAMSSPLVRAEEVDVPLCLSMAGNIGLYESLDFAIVMFIARKNECSPQASKKKKSSRKRRASSMDEELADPMVHEKEDHEEIVADDALGMLTFAEPTCRYHCFGMLTQTVCALASELRRVQGQSGTGPSSCWGLKLVPDCFVDDIGVDRAMSTLGTSMTIASRFLSEHGLPQGLDEAKFDAAQQRFTVGRGDAAMYQGTPSDVAALCYAVWASCGLEVILGTPRVKELEGSQACMKHAQELRTLLMRSLSVNHPLTFFRALCLSLQVVDVHPPLPADDLFKDRSFASAVVVCAMRAAAEALQDRRDLRAASDTDARMSSDLKEVCAPLCSATMRHVEQHFLSEDPSTCPDGFREMAWTFLEHMCWFCGQNAPEPVLQFCFPAAVACLSQAHRLQGRAVQEAVACCRCLQTAIEQLGRGILERLATLAPALLDLVCAGVAGRDDGGEGAEDAVALEETALQVLQSMVKAVGAFLSPFLERLLLLTTAACSRARTPLLEVLGRELVACVPHRLLLASITQVVASTEQGLTAASTGAAQADLGACLVRLQRLATFQLWLFSESAPEFISTATTSAFDGLLRLLIGGAKAAKAFFLLGGQLEELPVKLLGRGLPADPGRTGKPSWEACCSEGTVSQLNRLAAAAFAQFALRLGVDELKPCFVKVLEWARDSQETALALQTSRKSASEEELRGDTEASCRALALCATMQALAAEAPGISEELLLPLVLGDMASCLTASRQCALRLALQHKPARKRRKSATGEPLSVAAARSVMEVLHSHTWWWFDVSVATLRFSAFALQTGGSAAAAGEPATRRMKVLSDAVDALLEPCVDILDVFEFLPPVETSHLVGTLQQAIHGALVALASVAEGQKVKQLLTAILGKTRSGDVEVRLCAVRGCQKIWSELGVQVVSGLSEVVMFASELLEDEDNRVEDAVRVLIKTIENCTGESLQDALKH